MLDKILEASRAMQEGLEMCALLDEGTLQLKPDLGKGKIYIVNSAGLPNAYYCRVLSEFYRINRDPSAEAGWGCFLGLVSYVAENGSRIVKAKRGMDKQLHVYSEPDLQD